jgi:hypothetical protein
MQDGRHLPSIQLNYPESRGRRTDRHAVNKKPLEDPEHQGHHRADKDGSFAATRGREVDERHEHREQDGCKARANDNVCHCSCVNINIKRVRKPYSQGAFILAAKSSIAPSTIIATWSADMVREDAVGAAVGSRLQARPYNPWSTA